MSVSVRTGLSTLQSEAIRADRPGLRVRIAGPCRDVTVENTPLRTCDLRTLAVTQVQARDQCHAVIIVELDRLAAELQRFGGRRKKDERRLQRVAAQVVVLARVLTVFE